MKAKKVVLGFFLTLALTLFEFVWLGAILAGCSSGDPSEDAGEPATGTKTLSGVGGNSDASPYVVGPNCEVETTRYPTVSSDFSKLYKNRSFYADGNHLGHDVALPEGTPIYPIACGILRVYRPATGYGRLAIAIEHKLAMPITFLNGLGQPVSVTSFLSIYGHLRKSADMDGGKNALPFKEGDLAGPNDVIGYVDNDSTNGDGQEHLHVGIRLQSATMAMSTDMSWFRGYDTVPSQRQWFANPVAFLATLTSSATAVFWHPAGTVVRRANDNVAWMIDNGVRRRLIDPQTMSAEKLGEKAIDVSDGELACLENGEAYVSPRANSYVIKFDDASTVYEITGPADGNWRRTFITESAFYSWGWSKSEIAVWSANERAGFLAQTEDKGFRGLRDGALVQATGESEVSVVSDGWRLPIVDWPAFLALGYRAEQIVSVSKDVIDLLAGPRGPVITSDAIASCLHPNSCVDNCEESDNSSTEQIIFHYIGGVKGVHQFQGMWDPPGPGFFDWQQSTFDLCKDDDPNDSELKCLLDIPSGTTNFMFTVRLPDGRWWGDASCTPSGGCGTTIGMVWLVTGNNLTIDYELKNNGQGEDYYNGYLPLVP